MDNDKIPSTLWERCKSAFRACENRQVDDLLKNIVEIVIENYSIFETIADTKFLKFVLQMNINDYVIGTNGDDYKLRLKTFEEQKNLSIDEIWYILSQLIWDLTVPVTSMICPFCQCDNVVLLTDNVGEHLYESCENCFGTTEKGIQIMRPENLLPCSKEIIKKYNFWSIIEKDI